MKNVGISTGTIIHSAKSDRKYRKKRISKESYKSTSRV